MEDEDRIELTQDDMDRLKSRDARFAVLSRAISIEADLRDNPTIKALMAGIREDADRAMDEIAECSPGDIAAISFHLVRIKTLVTIRRNLNVILRQGAAAESSIRSEDHRENPNDE